MPISASGMRVFIDGKDISSMVTSLSVNQEVGTYMRVSLELAPHDVRQFGSNINFVSHVANAFKETLFSVRR